MQKQEPTPVFYDLLCSLVLGPELLVAPDQEGFKNGSDVLGCFSPPSRSMFVTCNVLVPETEASPRPALDCLHQETTCFKNRALHDQHVVGRHGRHCAQDVAWARLKGDHKNTMQ